MLNRPVLQPAYHFTYMSLWKIVSTIAMLCLGSLQTVRAENSTPPGLRVELEAMGESDQVHRFEARAVAEKFGHNSAENAALWEKQNAIDAANIKRLVEILESSGWPQQSIVGGKAAGAAFFVLQHASLQHQKRFLPMLREAVANSEARPQYLALLEDRILVREGRPQMYGSQLGVDPITGKHSFRLIEDEANVDRRRSAVGLEPLAEYAKRFGFIYERPKQ